MSLTFSWGFSGRVLVYALICTLIAAFGTMGAFIGNMIGPEFPLVGLMLGSVLGLFLALQQSTIVGCLVGMVTGLLLAVFVYFYIDFETAYMVVFFFSLFGAFLGEPFAYFWREANQSFDFSDSERM